MPAGYHYGAKLRIAPTGLSPASTAASLAAPCPIHVYHVESGKPVAVLLRPGKTPSGAEVRSVLKHLVRRIRRHWPRTRIVFRGDSHYGRPENMAWCEDNGVDYIFGLSGNSVLRALADEAADDLKVRRAKAGAEKMRTFAAFDYAAGS